MQVPAGLEELAVPRWSFRKVLDLITDGTQPRRFKTKAGVGKPASVSKKTKHAKGDYRLVFDLDRTPSRFRLYDVNGREKIREIAEEIKRLGARP